MGDTILDVKNLKVHFDLDEGLLKAVDGVDFTLKRKQTLGIVGESGSGKSVSAQSVLRIVSSKAKVEGELLLYRAAGQEPIDLAQLKANGAEIRSIRGGDIAMIFQEPMKAFSPIHTIGNQIIEAILLHHTTNKNEAKKIAIQALRDVGMSNPEQRYDQYPHELSGGMRQRAMIAMALSCNPSILIADEPTTALDVTVQAQVLDLINALKEKHDTSVMFITHDLGVIAETADEVAVMYLGQIVEYTDVDTLFHGAQHPYTRALLESMPSVAKEGRRLKAIEGTVPTPINMPKGCRYYTRCTLAQDGVCNVDDIEMVPVHEGHGVRCLFAEPSPKGEGEVAYGK
ncbi:ABC transporter ATP-binding protein [Aureibacillus halotolerans]|uniref:Peptide/nickel transport system ATP-binding protein n=1 Tax=Aureibacillus halotolerans TaxID=1508390 RepID=A0A4R6U4X4_9BACI|nr:ABC transporter ATP-binding protein [Aureibacillus halotolerans]TDQ40776.1 peptide/nickel transport system ATP-binding protein [Aureibacillus halotolerans]